jgi:N-acetyl sugar amidotransferase
MAHICTRCLMDDGVPDIRFDARGVCNYCEEFVQMMAATHSPDAVKRSRDFSRFVETVKRDGQDKEYDCIVGLSGGVDSAWVLYQAKAQGLRPLAVHMDNGWNSELAQHNIERLVKRLDVHLYTHVIDWVEYRGLMQAFFDADVVDVELLYDNAMFAVNYRLAAKYGIRWILAGTNKSTEGMRMPAGWNWFKFDARNIKRIGKRGGVDRLRTFPALGVPSYVWYEYVRKIKWVSFLDFLDYRKEEALQMLERECGYRRYPYKHYESIFTRFYQGYILPTKFGIDKRKLHLSTLVASGQMPRDEGLALLAQIPYPSQADMDSDRQYFLKKMNWTDQQLEAYIGRPGNSHAIYGSELGLWKALANVYKLVSGKPQSA